MTRSRRAHGIRESLSRATLVEGNVLRCSLPGAGGKRSVGGLLADHASRHPEHVVFLERRGADFQPTTWAGLRDQVVTLMAYLRAAGIGAGDRVCPAAGIPGREVEVARLVGHLVCE